MTKKFRWIAVLLAFATALAAIGCGKSGDTSAPVPITHQAGDLGVALSAPAETIDVAHFTNGVAVNGRENNEYGMLAARSLQGLINKTVPRLYIETVGQDKWGIQCEPIKKGALKTYGHRTLNELTDDKNPAHTGYLCFWSIFYKYRNEIDKLWVFEEYTASDKLYAVMNVAVMLAGRNGGVAVSRPLAEQIRAEGYLYETIDVEAYCGFTFAKDNLLTINQWAIDHLLEGTNRNMVFALCPQVRTWYAGMTESDQFPSSYDMAVALNAFIYTPVPYTPAGLAIEEDVLAHYDDGIPVIGWPGPYENVWVSHIAKCNKIVVSIDWQYENGSLWCAFPPYDHADAISPAPDPAAVQSYDDTIYIALEYSDGDAFHYCERDLVAHLTNPVIMDTDLPMGWSFPSIWRQFNPVLLEYCIEQARPGLDEFLQGPSGISYIYPSLMSERAYDNFLNRTKEVFGQLGITMTNYWDITPGGTNSMVGLDLSYLEKYVEVLQPYAVFRGQSSHTGDYLMIGDTVCVEKVGNFNGSGCQTAGDLVGAVHAMVERQKTGADAIRPDGPVFMMLDVNAWGDPIETTLPVFYEQLKSEGAHYEFVTPSMLVALIRDYEAGNSLASNPKWA